MNPTLRRYLEFVRPVMFPIALLEAAWLVWLTVTHGYHPPVVFAAAWVVLYALADMGYRYSKRRLARLNCEGL